MRKNALALGACVFASFMFAAASAQPQARQITIFNKGSEPIFWVQIGNLQAQSWSDDLLPFNDIVDVGEAKTLRVALSAQCVYDVRAIYRDRSESDVTNVNLCAAPELSFDR